jgi:hypothetical protein
MAGKVYSNTIVKLNGVDYGTKPDVTFKMGGSKGTAQVASGRISGFSHEPQPGEVSWAYEIKSKSDLEAIRKFDSGTVEVLFLETGHVYSIANAVLTEDVETTASGGVKLTAMGEPAVKVQGP